MAPLVVHFAIGGFVIALLVESDWLNIRIGYALLTLLLLRFLWIQVITIRLLHPQCYLLNPAILCAFVLFSMGYGVTNALFFLPPETVEFLGLVPDVFPAMVEHQYLALLAAIALFLGYWSHFAEHLTFPLAVTRFQQRYLPRTNMIKPWSIPLLLAISVTARLLAIALGIFGYGGNYSDENIAHTSAYSQYLGMAGSLGKLALLLASLQLYAQHKQILYRRMFLYVLATEVCFGLMSGMKSAVAMPFVTVGICQYISVGKLPKKWIIGTVLSLMVAYSVIEPFRQVSSSRGGSLTSVGSIIEVLQAGVEHKNNGVLNEEEHDYMLPLSIAIRSNLSYIGAFGLEYVHNHKSLPIGSPAFLEDIFLAPVHALIPRFIWDSKPLGTLGVWYNQEIMMKDRSSSTAMGPLAYLYFAGNYPAVAIVFYFIGILQRVFWFRLTPWKSMSGAVIMLSQLMTLSSVNSAVNGFFISLIREGLLVTILTHLLFYHSKPNKSKIFIVHGRI